MVESISSRPKLTPLQLAAARRNGAKTKGPKTEQGKKNSSRNSLKHALSCSSKTALLLPGEDATRLWLVTRAFQGYQTGNDTIVPRLIAQSWRSRRAFDLENRNLHALAARGENTDFAADHVLAEAWNELNYARSTAAVNRHLAAARSGFRAAVAQLLR